MSFLLKNKIFLQTWFSDYGCCYLRSLKMPNAEARKILEIIDEIRTEKDFIKKLNQTLNKEIKGKTFVKLNRLEDPDSPERHFQEVCVLLAKKRFSEEKANNIWEQLNTPKCLDSALEQGWMKITKEEPKKKKALPLVIALAILVSMSIVVFWQMRSNSKSSSVNALVTIKKPKNAKLEKEWSQAKEKLKVFLKSKGLVQEKTSDKKLLLTFLNFLQKPKIKFTDKQKEIYAEYKNSNGYKHHPYTYFLELFLKPMQVKKFAFSVNENWLESAQKTIPAISMILQKKDVEIRNGPLEMVEDILAAFNYTLFYDQLWNIRYTLKEYSEKGWESSVEQVIEKYK